MKANYGSFFNQNNNLAIDKQRVSAFFALAVIKEINFSATHQIVSDLIQFIRKASNEGQENIIRGKGLLINFEPELNFNQPTFIE